MFVAMERSSWGHGLDGATLTNPCPCFPGHGLVGCCLNEQTLIHVVNVNSSVSGFGGSAAMSGRSDNSLSRSDGDESFVEVNNNIEKKSHQDNEFVEQFGGMSKVSEILKKRNDCNART